MFVDEAKISVAAGNGGKGSIAFNKNMMSLGPTGGSGGKGGSVFFEGVSDLNALSQFRFKKEIEADNGRDGRGQFRDGSDGKDLIVRIPVGTVITKEETGEKTEITKIGETVLIAKGGRGGKGNFLFRSPRLTTPKIAEDGNPGEGFFLSLELRLIADIGLVGLPNAGKSTLLNSLTRANAKIGNYAFTTLEPNLGTYYDLIIADIPGLIEGASEGKGLGTKFLRHVSRTKEIFHLIAASSSDPVKDYRTIRNELEAYDPALTKKKEFVFLSKSDEVSPKELKDKLQALNKAGIEAVPFSAIDDSSIESIKKILNTIAEEKTEK